MVMSKAGPHHNGSTTGHFSLGNNVILKRILSMSMPKHVHAHQDTAQRSLVPGKLASGPLHTIASKSRRQKCSTARATRLHSGLVESPVNCSGTGTHIKILPLLTKFRIRSLSIRNSRLHKHSTVGCRRSPRPWSVSDVIGLAILCN